MRIVIAFIVLMGSVTFAEAACKGQTVMRPTKNGAMREVCLDGKYTTCIRDSRTGGWTQAEAKAFCDKRRAAGAIK
ncbi:MAG: hypothetical protein AB7K67_00215 [Hyphomicrobiaceae bacterium]